MFKPSWRLRRRATFGTLVFSLGMIGYVAFRWDSTPLAETLVLSMAGLAGGVVTAYIGFAVAEDRMMISKMGADNVVHDEVLAGSVGTGYQNVGAISRSPVGCGEHEHSDG